MGEPGMHHPPEPLDHLVEGGLLFEGGQPSPPELWCRPVGGAHVLHQEDVLGEGDWVGHLHTGLPQRHHHLRFVAGPTVLEQFLPVGRHRLDRSPIARLAELSSLSILHVVAEGRGTLYTHRLELPLGRDGARQVALLGEEHASAIVTGPLHDVDLGFLPGAKDTEVFVGKWFWHQPCRLVVVRFFIARQRSLLVRFRVGRTGSDAPSILRAR